MKIHVAFKKYPKRTKNILWDIERTKMENNDREERRKNDDWEERRWEQSKEIEKNKDWEEQTHLFRVGFSD